MMSLPFIPLREKKTGEVPKFKFLAKRIMYMLEISPPSKDERFRRLLQSIPSVPPPSHQDSKNPTGKKTIFADKVFLFLLGSVFMYLFLAWQNSTHTFHSPSPFLPSLQKLIINRNVQKNYTTARKLFSAVLRKQHAIRFRLFCDPMAHVFTAITSLKVDVTPYSPTNSRQEWNLRPLGRKSEGGTNDEESNNKDVFSILNSATDNGARDFLSVSGMGDVVDLWFGDDGSGRQQWRLIPAFPEAFTSSTNSSTLSLEVDEEHEKKMMSLCEKGKEGGLGFTGDQNAKNNKNLMLQQCLNVLRSTVIVELVGGTPVARRVLGYSFQRRKVELYPYDSGCATKWILGN